MITASRISSRYVVELRLFLFIPGQRYFDWGDTLIVLYDFDLFRDRITDLIWYSVSSRGKPGNRKRMTIRSGTNEGSVDPPDARLG